jgi:hypothetical protein
VAEAKDELERDDPLFEALWARVLEAWDDDKPHAALLDHAIRTQRLPDAAGRYRALKDDPAKAARAQKKLDGIVIAATQMLMSMQTPRPTKKGVPWPITLLAGLVMVVLLGWLTMVIFRRH